jgi:mannose-6-phosphate isomerase-like protein (cupin superfamily)
MGDVQDERVRQDWARRGFSCGVWIDSPGQAWEDYVHETEELLMLIEGEIEVSFQGETRRPRVGEEVLIPARARHTVINVGASTNRWYYGYKLRS